MDEGTGGDGAAGMEPAGLPGCLGRADGGTLSSQDEFSIFDFRFMISFFFEHEGAFPILDTLRTKIPLMK